MSSNTSVSAIDSKPHYLPPVVEYGIEKMVATVNPFSRLEQHDRQLKLMNKTLRVKKAIIRDAEKKARTFSYVDPKKAEQYQNLADRIKKTMPATEAKRDYAALDKKIERVGKFAFVTDKVIPGAGVVVSTGYSLGKVINVATYAFKPQVEMSEKMEKIKSASKDLAITGALIAGSFLSAYAWSLLA